jgi:hypothetical protein
MCALRLTALSASPEKCTTTACEQFAHYVDAHVIGSQEKRRNSERPERFNDPLRRSTPNVAHLQRLASWANAIAVGKKNYEGGKV